MNRNTAHARTKITHQKNANAATITATISRPL
jgi:hypothetical protein